MENKPDMTQEQIISAQKKFIALKNEEIMQLKSRLETAMTLVDRALNETMHVQSENMSGLDLLTKYEEAMREREKEVEIMEMKLHRANKKLKKADKLVQLHDMCGKLSKELIKYYNKR